MRSPIIALAALSAGYLAMLLWADSQRGIGRGLELVWKYAPYLIGAVIFSFTFRYFRWVWLLRRAGCSFPIERGLLPYLAGFAYTATPGKVGELIRIRYFAGLGVPAEQTFGAFIFERGCDLVAVLLLSLFIIGNSGLIPIAVGFVLVVIGALLVCIFHPSLLKALANRLAYWRLPIIPRMLNFLASGIGGCRGWLNLVDLAVGVMLGLIAWGLVAMGFVYILFEFSGAVPFLDAISIYPLSMLVGAASMIPGGFGSTEGSIVLLLDLYEIELGTAALLAVVIRVATLWFGILLGFLSLGYLEMFWRTDGYSQFHEK